MADQVYRVYPHTNEPFVNTVRQSLLQNTLCLIGFSGDDPNFLQWIGWTRDQVGQKKPPNIYLVGVLNGLGEGEWKLLDARNIVVVDLAPFSGSRDGVGGVLCVPAQQQATGRRLADPNGAWGTWVASTER